MHLEPQEKIDFHTGASYGPRKEPYSCIGPFIFPFKTLPSAHSQDAQDDLLNILFLRNSKILLWGPKCADLTCDGIKASVSYFYYSRPLYLFLYVHTGMITLFHNKYDAQCPKNHVSKSPIDVTDVEYHASFFTYKADELSKVLAGTLEDYADSNILSQLLFEKKFDTLTASYLF